MGFLLLPETRKIATAMLESYWENLSDSLFKVGPDRLDNYNNVVVHSHAMPTFLLNPFAGFLKHTTVVQLGLGFPLSGSRNVPLGGRRPSQGDKFMVALRCLVSTLIVAHTHSIKDLTQEAQEQEKRINNRLEEPSCTTAGQVLFFKIKSSK